MSSAAKKGVSKKPVARAPVASKVASKSTAKATFHDSHAHLFNSNKRHFGIGQAIPPKKDLTRFVKWPKYVRLQRQRSILKKRLKVPPAINQFSKTIDKNQASTLLRLLSHYRPETRQEKTARLKTVAEQQVKGQAQAPKSSVKPLFIKYGLNHVTDLIESKKAKLVVIAHDVDPIELVVFLPALCRKMNIPYCVIKGKSRLGHLVHKKTVSAIAITEVRKEDAAKLEQFVNNVRSQFNDSSSIRKQWGGGINGAKSNQIQKKKEQVRAAELAKVV